MQKEYFIVVNIKYLIFGFESREEARIFFKENKLVLESLNKESDGDESTLEIKSKKQLETIVLDCFFGNQGEDANYEPIWVNKKDNLNNLV
jgi:hypothetical protein